MQTHTLLMILNLAIAGLFALCYFNQFFYIFVALFKKDLPHKAEAVPHRFAVLIAARNEAGVIGNLIDSLNAQDYPRELFDIFIGADNCTDDTARVGAAHGAVVYERRDTEHLGKGYVLDFLLSSIDRDYGKGHYDAYLVFDADNLVTQNYLTEINKTFSDGYRVVTSYRNTQNYGDSWLSAGSGLWFLRDSRYLNGSRQKLGACCFVSGTGYLFSREIKETCGGFPFHLLTEDAELTAYLSLAGETIGYCPTAEFFDEQPATFQASVRQRTRWVQGGMQVFRRYGRRLLRGIFTKRFLTFYDFSFCMAPAYVLSLLATVANTVCLILGAVTGDFFPTLLQTGLLLFACYLFLLFYGLVATVSERKKIHAPTGKKILGVFTFPLFMISYLPACFAAVFKKREWVPVEHNSVTSVEDLPSRKTKED